MAIRLIIREFHQQYRAMPMMIIQIRKLLVQPVARVRFGGRDFIV